MMAEQPVPNERTQQFVREIRNRINDYRETIWAIVGFVNLYFLDDKTYQPQPHVRRFQGRKLTPSDSAEQPHPEGLGSEVFPDFGLVFGEDNGILGEVKMNFPKGDFEGDFERARDVFHQLKHYDQHLTGWPTSNEQIGSHEVVLLVHLTTSQYAVEFCQGQLPMIGITFDRPFSIVEFARIMQTQDFFSFRTALRVPTDVDDKNKLRYGVHIPMLVILNEYTKTKLYDAEPPLPYLVALIWSHVVTPQASESARFERLRKGQRLNVYLTIEDIVNTLDEGFSFKHWQRRYPERQPPVPRREWVKRACEFLVDSGEGEWEKDSVQAKLAVFFKNYKDVDQHFIDSWATLQDRRTAGPMLPGFEPTNMTDAS